MLEPHRSETTPSLQLDIKDWGLIPYEDALEKQLSLVQHIAENNLDGTFVFCSHPPVVTLGRATQPEDYNGWNGEIVNVSRGGRATYHGPSQIVVYPILNLKKVGQFKPAKDIGAVIQLCERVLIETLSEYGVKSEGRSFTSLNLNGEELECTGVWIESRKIASIGIAVKKWISYHGIALNIDNDPKAFQGMRPCGFSKETMISLQEVLNQDIERASIKSALKKNLMKYFS